MTSYTNTDGSRIENRSAAAAVKDDHIYSERLPDFSTIFTAEMHAIFLALDHIETSEKLKILNIFRFFICIAIPTG